MYRKPLSLRLRLAPPLLRLPKVNVSPDREIRTVVGLRPFRPSGFVVAGQKFDEKLVVHNYGHGGGGVTFSWGTGELACREVDATGVRNIAVLGCGAVGLATARLLQERGCRVTIYTKALPPDTTSNIAGAQWCPCPSTIMARRRRASCHDSSRLRTSQTAAIS